MAAAGSVAFTKLTVTTGGSLAPDTSGNRAVFDMVFEPGNANNLICSVSGTNAAGDGGIYRSTNALAVTPTFAQTMLFDSSFVRAALAVNKVGSTVTVYAATSETPTNTTGCTSANSGAVRKSTDGGQTWSGQLTGGGGFCDGQCTYDIAIAVHPNDANILYIGGQARGTCADGMKRSADGGATFLRDDTGLHADSHALFIDPLTNPVMVYTTNDGGVWKRADAAAGTAWTNLNTSPLDTIQFVSVAVHPLDRNLTMGGTQDNGTELQQSVSGSWTKSVGGDGGYALIDQSATDTRT